MAFPIHLRDIRGGRWLGARLLCCFVLTNSARATWAQTPAMQGQSESGQVESAQGAPAQSADGAGAGTTVVAAGSHPVDAAPGKRHVREAEDAYLAGAKKLERDDLNGAEREFTRAQNLDPQNRDYAIAISLARQHRLTKLV